MRWWRRLLEWVGLRRPAATEDDPHLCELERRMTALDMDIAVQARREREKRRHATR